MKKSRVSIIVAMDEKRGIGKDNELLFKIPEDMKRMKALTTGHPLVMGRKTFESLGRLLPDRTHIVVTGDPKSLDNFNYKPHFIVSSIEEGIDIGKKSAGGEEVFIFGGGKVFISAIELDLVDRLYLTLVKSDFKADTFFPDYSDFSKVISKEAREDGGTAYSFLVLEKL